MTSDARLRIDAHRLLRKHEDVADYVTRIDSARDDVYARKKVAQRTLARRVVVHVITFILAFFFTAGFMLVGVLLWVRPDALFSLVLVGLLCSLLFVAVFSSIRMLILHNLLDEYPNKEEDPGMHHHWGKSIAYGLLALILAFLIVGLLVNLATAFTVDG